MQQQSRVFVSHSHADNAWCSAFVDALRRRGADVWYDEQSLRRGTLWREINNELEVRHVFIVVFSPDAFSSTWVDLEINAAIALQAKDKGRVILPVIARKCVVPPMLSGLKYLGSEEAGLSPEEAADEVARALDLPAPLIATEEARPVPDVEAGRAETSVVQAAPETPSDDATDTLDEQIPGVLIAEAPVTMDGSESGNGPGGKGEGTSATWEQPLQLPGLFRHAATDLYDEERQRFLVRYPAGLIIGLALSGLLAVSSTGFFGYRDPLESPWTAAAFHEPWPLFLWFCALIIVLEVSILRAPALRGLLVAVLVVTMVSIVAVAATYLFSAQAIASIVFIVPSLSGAIRFPTFSTSPWTYTLFNFGVLGIYAISSIVRWIQRARGRLPAPTSSLVTEKAPAMPSLLTLVAGDLLAGSILALLLAVVLRPTVIGALGSALQGSRGGAVISGCALSWPVGPCDITGPRAPTLAALDTVIALVVLEHALVVVSLALGTDGPRAVYDVLRGAVTLRVRVPINGLVLSLRNLLWPVLIFVSVLCAAGASRSIQTYYHLVSDSFTCHDATSCGGAEEFVLTWNALAQYEEYKALAFAVALLVIAGVALFAALGLRLFRWRVVQNSTRFVVWVLFVWLSTEWIFSLFLSGVNALVLLADLSKRVPFPQPSLTAALSLTAFAVFLGYSWARRRSGNGPRVTPE